MTKNAKDAKVSTLNSCTTAQGDFDLP